MTAERGVTSMKVREAESYYSEFKGDPPLREEIVADRDEVWVKYYKKMACTFGFEIEQDPDVICRRLQDTYVWHHDASGPLETATAPVTYPGVKLKAFIDNCKRLPDCVWRWHSQFRRFGDLAGCGSHLHMRPRDDVEYIYREWMEAWATAHNTLIECVPLVIPMFAWGTGTQFRFRDSALRWGQIQTRRLSVASMERFFEPSYIGSHPYHNVALNRKIREKPLTLELRLNESHPGIAYETAILLNRIIRKCFERGFVSPKLRNRVQVINAVKNAVGYSISRDQNLYDSMETNLSPESIGPIKFLPRRNIPGLKQTYNGWGDLFDDILINYGHPYPPMARVCRLFLRRGDPFRNPNAVWDVFNPYGAFSWEQDIPVR